MRTQKYEYQRVLAIEYDGKSMIELMEETGWTADGCRLYIESEGGFIDDNSTIHRGNAVNRSLEELKNFKPMCSEWESRVGHDRLMLAGLASDYNGFALTKEEQIKAGLRKGKVYEPYKFKDMSEHNVDLEYDFKTSTTVFDIMLKRKSLDYEFIEAEVRYLGGHIDDEGNIIW